MEDACHWLKHKRLRSLIKHVSLLLCIPMMLTYQYLHRVLSFRFLKGLMEQFNSSSDVLVGKLRESADGTRKVSMVEEFQRLTLDLIGKVC